MSPFGKLITVYVVKYLLTRINKTQLVSGDPFNGFRVGAVLDSICQFLIGKGLILNGCAELRGCLLCFFYSALQSYQ